MRVYTRGDHRFFDRVVALLVSLASLGKAINVQSGGFRNAYGPRDCIAIAGIAHVSGLELRFYPYHVLESLLRNEWPDRLELEDCPLAGPPGHLPLTVDCLRLVQGLMSQWAFVSYFESVRPEIEALHGTDPYQWPGVCNFARVVRNAFSHGGEIYFSNPGSQGVCWSTLTYSPADNGRQILYRDVTPVEIVLLMEDVDAVL